MRSTKYRTHLILEPMRITCMLNALIDDGKSYMMSIISRQISTKRTDALYSACFCMHVSACKSLTHTASQRSIDSGDGHSRIKMNVDILIVIGIAQEAHLHFCCHIIVE